MTQNHPYHLVFNSPWPLLAALNALSLLMGTVIWINSKSNVLMMTSTLVMMITSFQWWRDISRESSMQGYHTLWVITGMRWGMILFITSEVLFFMSFFWAFFHSSLAPNFEMGAFWPPMGILSLNPFQVPLLNTAVLLASGVTVTWAHHSIIMMNNKAMNKAMQITIILGVYFSMLQGWEYWDASYSLSDSVFGSTFFLATGFHGLHVIIGSMFLMFSFIRHKMNIFSYSHHIGLEMAIWYWHFVDVVWLFLYTFIYWWSY